MTWLWQPLLPGAAQLQAGGASIVSGVGSSSGAATVSGVGASTSAQVGSSSGTGTASATGASTSAQVGAATGTSTASGIGASTAEGVGSASGVGTATGISEVTVEAVGSAAGSSTATGVSADTTTPTIVGGWSWPVETGRKERKRKELILRPDIERIFARVVKGEVEAPEVQAIAAKAVQVAAPYMHNGQIDWAEFEQHRRALARLETLLNQYERAVIEEEDEIEELLLLS